MKNKDFDFANMTAKRDFDFSGMTMAEPLKIGEPAPYNPLEYMTEDVGKDFNLTLAPIARPFLATGFTAAESFNRGIATFVEGWDCMADWVADTTGTEKGGAFEQIAETYNSNADYWQGRAQKVGQTFLDEMIGEAIGGALPGISEFLLDIPYAGFLGAAEAHKEGRNEFVGALTEGAKRGVLGQLFKMIGPYKQYLRAPTMGSIFALQTLGEGGTPREAAKGMGTGMLYSMSSPGGQMGLNEIRANLRTQTPSKGKLRAKAEASWLKEKKVIQESWEDPISQADHVARNAIMKTAGELVKIKKTDPAAYKRDMAELGRLDKAYNASSQFARWFKESRLNREAKATLTPVVTGETAHSILKGDKGKEFKTELDPQTLKNIPSEALIWIPNDRIATQVMVTNETGGSTFNIKGQSVWTEGYGVATYPKHTQIVKGKLTEKQLAGFYKKHEKLLKENPNLTVGTRYNAETGKTEVDISAVVKDKQAALELAKKYKQEAIYDFKNQEEICFDEPTVILEHWTSAKDLTEIDPAKYGTGIKGAEAKRQMEDPDNWVNRSYYGIKGGGYKPESELGPIRHELTVSRSKLYDFSKDPLNLKEGIIGEGNLINLYEKAIQDAGYKGYQITSAGRGKIAAVFEKLPLKKSFEFELFPTEGTRVIAEDSRGNVLAEVSPRTPEEIFKAEKKDATEKGVVDFIRERRLSLNTAAYDTNRFTNEIDRTLSRREREAVSILLEKTELTPKLKRPDLEELVKNPSPEMVEVAEKVRVHFKKKYQESQDPSSHMSAQMIENYVTHLWDHPKGKGKHDITNWFITRNRFMKKRTFDTLNDGIEAGFIPKTLDVSEVIRIHDSVCNKVIENNKFVEQLNKLETKDGQPMILRMDKAPSDWQLFDHPALRRTLAVREEKKVTQQVSTDLKNILSEIGVSIGRKLDPHGKYAGWFDPSKKEIRTKESVEARTVAHEIGHALDYAFHLTDAGFLKYYKTELHELNKKRINDPKYKDYKEYTMSGEEQIAEFFAELLTRPQRTAEIAPNAYRAVLEIMGEQGTLSRLLDFNFEKSAFDVISTELLKITPLPVKVHPDLVKPLQVVFDSLFQHEAIQAYEVMNGILKKTQLSLSFFHHLALAETAVALMGAKQTAKVLFNPFKIYQAMAKGEFDIYKKETIARDAIEAGVQVGATADVPVAMIQEKLNNLARKTKDKVLIGKTTEYLSSFNKGWDRVLWNYLHDTLKLYAYESLVTKVDPKLNIKKQKQEIAQLVNDTFGGQNWDILMTRPQTLQIMRWMLLSPDWTVSTIRQALSPLGIGKMHMESKGLRQEAGVTFWLRAAIYYGVGINMMNALMRVQDEKEHPELYPSEGLSFLDKTMTGNTYGHKTHLFLGRYEDGSERYLRWGKQFRELPELLWDSSGGFCPITATLKKLGGKGAPALQVASQIFTGGSLSSFKNRDIEGKKGWDKVGGIAKMLCKSPLPFASRNLMNDGKEFHLTDLAMPSSKGMTRYKAVDLYKQAIYRHDEQMVQEVYVQVLRNNLPAHTLFTASLTMVKAESTREYNKSLATLSDVNKKLQVERNPIILKKLLDLKERMIKENVNRQIGIKRLTEAIIELRKYEMLNKRK
jgi:hypothetical protein